MAILKRFSYTIQQRPSGSKGRKCYGILRIVLEAVITVVVVSLISIVASRGGYIIFDNGLRLERAIANYESKKYDRAFSTLVKLANKGMARAQLYLGDCYANGNGVVKDQKMAVKWYCAAADQNLVEAKYRMYVCYRDGIGVPKDSKNAIKWFSRMLDKINVIEQCDLDMIHDNRKGLTTCKPKEIGSEASPTK